MKTLRMFQGILANPFLVLQNRYTVILCVPAILLLCGALAKKLVRGSDFERRDFYLGIEFTLAAMSSALIYFFQLAEEIKPDADTTLVRNKMLLIALFLCVTFFLLFFVMATHQVWEKRAGKWQLFWLLGVANLIGSGLMATFILLIKRGI